MCLIIQREPNFEIPFEKFKAAIQVNPDGYGLSYPDENGKLVTVRDPKKPDPDQLYRFINEELKDRKLLLHLRYTTAGETNLRNAHPFPILERNKDGVDLRMAHNGTLGSYKSSAAKGESDTRNFVKSYVRPLFKRMSRAMDPEELMSDPFLKQLLEDKLTAASVLTFLDGNGNSLLCNAEGNGGKQEDGWYYSNTYSFKADHRSLPVTKNTGNVSSLHTPPRHGKGGVSSQVVSVFERSFNTPRFTDKYNIEKVRDLTKLTDVTISRVVVEGDGTILIKELLHELNTMYKVNKQLNNTIASLKKKVN